MAEFFKKTKLLISIVGACILIACGHGMVLTEQWGKVVNHGFEFNAATDSPDIEILNYEYSNQKPWRDELLRIGRNHVTQASHIYGGFPVGDFIYMKWRVRSTGEVFEDRVDLKGRLPRDMTDQQIYCVIDGEQLYVFIVSSETRKKIDREELKKYEKLSNQPLERMLSKTLTYKNVTKIYPDTITQLR
jgi:hypothetical protein